MNLDDLKDNPAKFNPTSQVGAFCREIKRNTNSKSNNEIFDDSYNTFAFSHNKELDNCDLLRSRSSRKNFILLDDYLGKVSECVFPRRYL